MTDSEFKTQVVLTLESISLTMKLLAGFAGSALILWLAGVNK